MSDALTEFLLARIAEDEAEIAAGFDFAVLDSSGWMGHAATWGRDRALAECEVKRQIVETRNRLADVMAAQDPLGMGDDAQLYTLDWVLARLALPYADHPDYLEEWKP